MLSKEQLRTLKQLLLDNQKEYDEQMDNFKAGTLQAQASVVQWVSFLHMTTIQQIWVRNCMKEKKILHLRNIQILN